jgi:serine/threonine protein kinase
MASNDNTVLSTTNTDFSERSEGFASDQQFLDTPGSFFTATPGYSVGNPTPHEPSADSEYGLLLRENKLLVARDVELNWSGKGQHVEYKIGEAIPLDVIKTIGHSATALVEAVRCRRILLARKSIQCNRYVKLPQLISEVEHLHRLRHPHIIQLVGSYLHNKTFAMLLYPVADYDLSVFMDKVSEAIRKRPKYSLTIQWARHLSKFFLCLAHALKYMHSQGTMHMDIKPSNILVKGPGFSSWLSFKVYM